MDRDHERPHLNRRETDLRMARMPCVSTPCCAEDGDPTSVARDPVADEFEMPLFIANEAGKNSFRHLEGGCGRNLSADGRVLG